MFLFCNISCLGHIENYDRDEEGNCGEYAWMVKERRFLFYNNEWVKTVQKSRNKVVDRMHYLDV